MDGYEKEIAALNAKYPLLPILATILNENVNDYKIVDSTLRLLRNGISKLMVSSNDFFNVSFI